MIIGIGTDIVSVGRIRASLERHGERLADRILAETERADYTAAGDKAAFLAKRFAVKEAAAKAFGTGFSDGLAMSHIGVGHNARGRPDLQLFGRAAALAEDMGVRQALVTVSDEKEHAVAFVVLSGES